MNGIENSVKNNLLATNHYREIILVDIRLGAVVFKMIPFIFKNNNDIGLVF